MNFLKMQKKVAAIVAAAMITTTLVPMGAIAMAENQTEKKESAETPAPAAQDQAAVREEVIEISDTAETVSAEE